MTTRQRPSIPDIFASTEPPAAQPPARTATSLPGWAPPPEPPVSSVPNYVPSPPAPAATRVRTQSTVVYLDATHMQFLRACKILALQGGARDVSVTAIVRYAMDQLILAHTPNQVVDLVKAGDAR